MNASPVVVFSTAVLRAIIVVLGGVISCTAILGAVGFTLATLYTYLASALDPTLALFVAGGVALIVPALATVGIVGTIRAQASDRPAMSWLVEDSRIATLGVALNRATVR